MVKFITDSEKYNGRGDLGRFITYVDEPKALGGTDNSPSPTDYFLLSLASCIGFTLKMYADRKEIKLGKVHVECSFSKNEAGEKIIEKKVYFEDNLDIELENKLIKISDKCPVSKMIETPIIYIK